MKILKNSSQSYSYTKQQHIDVCVDYSVHWLIYSIKQYQTAHQCKCSITLSVVGQGKNSKEHRHVVSTSSCLICASRSCSSATLMSTALSCSISWCCRSSCCSRSSLATCHQQQQQQQCQHQQQHSPQFTLEAKLNTGLPAGYRGTTTATTTTPV